jgi:hypothetical protein
MGTEGKRIDSKESMHSCRPREFRRYESEGGTSKAAGAAFGGEFDERTGVDECSSLHESTEDYEVKRSEARKRGARAPTNQSGTAPGEAGRAAGQKSTRLLAGGTSDS